jgi:hypothetical protein
MIKQVPLCPRHNPPKLMTATEIRDVFACECGNQEDRRPQPILKGAQVSKTRTTKRDV